MKYIDMLLECLFGNEPPEPEEKFLWDMATTISAAILTSVAVCVGIYLVRRFGVCVW